MFVSNLNINKSTDRNHDKEYAKCTSFEIGRLSGSLQVYRISVRFESTVSAFSDGWSDQDNED